MKAKMAWLCYDEDETCEIRFSEPPNWCYSKVVPIVYFEVEP